MKRILLSTLFCAAALCVTFPTPSRASLVLDDAVPQYGRVTAVADGAAPFTVCVWGKPDQTDLNGSIFNTAKSDSADHWWMLRFGSNSKVELVVRDTGTSTVTVAASYSANAWHHVCGVEASTSSRNVRMNNGTPATSTTTRAPTGMDRTCIGEFCRSSPTNYLGGKVAEVCIWSIALNDTDIANLYNSGAGAPCTNVQGGNLVGYYKLISDANDSAGSNHLTLTGSPTFDSGDHPVIHRQRVQVIIVE